MAVDHALVKAGEARHRSGMRAELLDALNAARARWSDELNVRQRSVDDRLAKAVQASIDRVFGPARHGS